MSTWIVLHGNVTTQILSTHTHTHNGQWNSDSLVESLVIGVTGIITKRI